MRTTSVDEAIGALLEGRGPVEVTVDVARELSARRPDLLNGETKRLRSERFGPAPYSRDQYSVFELVILPTPDEPGSHERKVIAKIDKKLHEVTDAAAAALERFQHADEAWIDAARALHNAGGSGPIIMNPLTQEVRILPRVPPDELENLNRAHREAGEAREYAAEDLRRALRAEAAERFRDDVSRRRARFRDAGDDV